MEDALIIELYNRRDERAITETDQKYGKYCFVIAKNILSDDGASEECVNDTWLTLWGLIPPEVPKCLRAFCGKITRNLALVAYNKAVAVKRGGGQTALAIEELDDCISPENVERECEIKELARVIDSFLRALPKKECDIFVARYYFTYPTGEIAAKFGMSENHVRAVLSRTRKKLAERLGKEAWTK